MPSYMMRVTLDILLLRRGPQDLPAQRNLLYTVVAVYVVITALAYLSIMELNVLSAVLQAGSSLVYLAGFVWAVLAIAGRRARFLQTFTAMVATAIVFNVLEVGPLIKLMPYFLQMQEVVEQAQAQGGQVDPAAARNLEVPGFALALLLVEYVWRLLVMAHILHHALEITRGRAMAVALLYPGIIMLLVLVSR